MGLINFGLEVMNLQNVPIYVMSKMKKYIENNTMFNELILNSNICLNLLKNNEVLDLGNNVFIKPFEVPHRNELSETVGFKIKGSKESIIYLPDIDSWDGFENEISLMIKENNLLFIDGTFFTKEEIKNRDISKIPHPEILDTMNRFSNLSNRDKKKLHFIHFNHTNGILQKDRQLYDKVLDLGFSISEEGQSFNINYEH